MPWRQDSAFFAMDLPAILVGNRPMPARKQHSHMQSRSNPTVWEVLHLIRRLHKQLHKTMRLKASR